MTLSELTALGVTCVGGQLDYKNENIGFLALDGECVVAPDAIERLLKDKPRAKPGPKPKQPDAQ